MRQGQGLLLTEVEVVEIEKQLNSLDLFSLDDAGRKWAIRCTQLVSEFRRLQSIVERPDSDEPKAEPTGNDTVVL